METVEKRGTSRRFKEKNSETTYQKSSHFRMARSGGFEEGQVIYYLWDIVKSLETRPDTVAARGTVLKKQLRRRVRVEMKRYFARRKRKNVNLLAGVLCAFLCVGWLFGFVIGIDRVSEISIYPYLNDGDWITYSRISGGLRRDGVVIFEKSGEVMMKRVAGLSGDRVGMNRTGNQVVVDGEQIRKEFVTITEPVSGERREQTAPTQVVMNGQCLVLGDSRAESMDGRDDNIGTVPEEGVLGKVILIVRDGR